jgi:hypothetical protein
LSAGSNKLARMAMIAMTTSSSKSVNADPPTGWPDDRSVRSKDSVFIDSDDAPRLGILLTTVTSRTVIVCPV